MNYQMKDPPHVGEFLADELQALGVTVVDAAAALGVARPGLTMLLKGRRDLTPEMAVKFEAATGIDAELLVRMQLAFDMAQVRKRMDEVAGGIRRFARAA